MAPGVLTVALGSRAAVLVLGAASALLVEPYDTSASIPSAAGEAAAAGPLRGFGHWDGVYFLAIARRGFVYEQEHAFFPLYPACVRAFASIARLAVGAQLFEAQLFLLSAIAVSNVAFVAAAVVLHRLCLALTSDAPLSRRAALLFCFTPASVFMSAAYTESAFALLSFSGALLLARGRPAAAALCFALAGAARSNGVLLCALLAHDGLSRAWRGRQRPLAAFASLLAAGLRCLLVVLPFAAFQFYGYTLYCQRLQPPRPWCSRPLPLLYSFVQEHYWNVGFLRYYEAKQLPNFALAAPALGLSAAGVYRYASACPARFFSGGVVPGRGPATGFLSPPLAPFIQLWAFSSLFAALCMHVQVATRFLSASPPFYLYCALLVGDTGAKGDAGVGVRARLVWGYFAGYAAVGTILFCAFYPWT